MRDFMKPAKFFGFFLAVILALKYLMPYLLPFAAGLVIALLAEPLVSFSVKYFRMPRGAAAGLGVSITLLLSLALLSVLGALAVKELGMLANALPDMENTAREGLNTAENLLMGAAKKAPKGIRPLLLRSVSSIFDQDSQLFGGLSERLPRMVTEFLSRIPTGALTFGTWLLASFMISARLPKLKTQLSEKLPPVWKETYIPAIKRTKKALGGWFKAQAQISGITFVIITVGFLLLKIPYAPLWAALVALVDAVPVLGTGTVLIPWGIVSILQEQHLLAAGLFGIYGICLLTRTVLEPRLMGRNLNLDPLVTLICLYLGFRIWGVLGLLAAPVLAATVKNLMEVPPAATN